MTILMKQLSSMLKIRTRQDMEHQEVLKSTLLQGESFHYQIVIYSKESKQFHIRIESDLKDSVKLYEVKNSIMDHPVSTHADDDVITTEPGTMPDLLVPLEEQEDRVRAHNGIAVIWVSLQLPEQFKPGSYPISVHLSSEQENENILVTKTLLVDLLSEALPKQTLKVTQWFHVDCIASAHHVPVYSEEHWELIDRYMKMAVSLGINMILTPIITPPLDTKIGTARPCTQLVRIEKKDETYTFDFSLLERWIQMCKQNGVQYYEMAHLFSQWGLSSAPNIEVSENGKASYLFGWDIDAKSPVYENFLKQFLLELMRFLEQQGIQERCYFHISDEPGISHVERYRSCREMVKPFLGNCHMMDALSNIEFYKENLVEIPVVALDHVTPFLDCEMDQHWIYYCCGQDNKVSNRFLSMPHYRNRILGIQMYKYGIQGFLQWGYNFYYSQCSEYSVNPYVTTSGDKAFPSGDPFSVYPGNQKPLPSTRALIFKKALEDFSVCQAMERKIGRVETIEWIEKEASMEITFFEYPRNDDFCEEVIEKMKKELG